MGWRKLSSWPLQLLILVPNTNMHEAIATCALEFSSEYSNIKSVHINQSNSRHGTNTTTPSHHWLPVCKRHCVKTANFDCVLSLDIAEFVFIQTPCLSSRPVAVAGQYGYFHLAGFFSNVAVELDMLTHSVVS